MTLVVTHTEVTGAAADPTALVDGPAWDANHTLTGVTSPSQGGTGVANNDASTITITGSFGITFTVTAATSLTFPTTGTVATLAGTETLSNKTLVAPALGTPASGVLTNCTGLPTAGIVDAAVTYAKIQNLGALSVMGRSANSTGVGANISTTSSSDSVLRESGGVLGFGAISTNAIGGLGTGVQTALGVNVGTAGAFVTFNGALGTPSSGTATNLTGLPVGTGISGLGAGVATFLATPSSANLASAVTGETGSGALVFGTSPTITTPNTVGTGTNDAAAAGSVGEYVSSTVVIGSAVAITTATDTNVTSISLTAGDWDVRAVAYFLPANTTNMSKFATAISQTSASLSSSPGQFFSIGIAGVSGKVYDGNSVEVLSVPDYRISLSATTTIYLVVRSTFTTSTNAAYGIISARRIR